ncbi:MAG: NAD(P)-dependent oxidoreductase, partial [Actinomycetota bacterium]
MTRPLRVFVTHNPEDLEAYYGRAMPELVAITGVTEVVANPLDRDLSTDELLAAAEGCHVIVAHRATPGEAELFAGAPDLLAFLRTAVDISTVDLAAASAAGVLVARAGPAYVASTAEIALGLLIDVARGIGASTTDYQQGVDPPQRPGFQLRGKTAGIIGYGLIGAHLADLLVAVGLDVLISDPYVDATDVPAPLRMVGFEALLADSDIVFPLAASTPETENLIDAAALAAMRPGATLINVSRGELLDEAAVAAALDAGRLGRLAMDVGRAPDQRPSPELAGR